MLRRTGLGGTSSIFRTFLPLLHKVPFFLRSALHDGQCPPTVAGGAGPEDQTGDGWKKAVQQAANRAKSVRTQAQQACGRRSGTGEFAAGIRPKKAIPDNAPRQHPIILSVAARVRTGRLDSSTGEWARNLVRRFRIYAAPCSKVYKSLKNDAK